MKIKIFLTILIWLMISSYLERQGMACNPFNILPALLIFTFLITFIWYKELNKD